MEDYHYHHELDRCRSFLEGSLEQHMEFCKCTCTSRPAVYDEYFEQKVGFFFKFFFGQARIMLVSKSIRNFERVIFRVSVQDTNLDTNSSNLSIFKIYCAKLLSMNSEKFCRQCHNMAQ